MKKFHKTSVNICVLVLLTLFSMVAYAEEIPLEKQIEWALDYEKYQENEKSKSEEVQSYNIYFNSNGGTEIELIEVKENEKVTKPDNPTKKKSDKKGCPVLSN